MNTAADMPLDGATPAKPAKPKAIKCVVWDLDHTLWDGILAEGDAVALKPGVVELIKALDARGILHSICSRNTHEDAWRQLEQFGLAEYFLYPQINWGAKSAGIANIQRELNIGMDTLLFIDDQPFERDEVAAAHPSVSCLDAQEYGQLLEHPRIRSVVITEDAGRRRQMYLEDMERRQAESSHEGMPEAFLATLNMQFHIAAAQEADLLRAEELTVRTNQLNSTGITYGMEELRSFMHSPDHSLLICELTDRYGSYGKIGLTLVAHEPGHDHIKLLLMSCRTASRGVGSVLLSHLMRRAAAAGKRLRADFRRTERNRQMLVTYQFSGFREVSKSEQGDIVFEHDLSFIQDDPSYIEIRVEH